MGDRTRIRMYANQNTPSSSTPIPSGFVHQRPFPVPVQDTSTQPEQPIDLQAKLEIARRVSPDLTTLKFSAPRPPAGPILPSLYREPVVAADQRPSIVQAKLTVGAPNDQYEQEADHVADQVMSMPDAAVPQPVQRDAMSEEEEVRAKPLAASITPLIQRVEMPEEDEKAVQPKTIASIQREELTEENEETNPIQPKTIATSDLQREAIPEDEGEMQRKPLSHSTLQRSPDGSLQAGGDLESRLSSSQGGGSPLPNDVRSFMEPRFGADFSQVRVHTGSDAVQMNRDLNAQAFTHKQDVYFGAGKAPAKDGLTAHELTHVIQQGSGTQLQQVVHKQSAPNKGSVPTSTPSNGQGLAEKIIADVQNDGLTVAVYAASGVKDVSEFNAQASQFAEDHQAVGISNGQVCQGTKAAMQMNDDLPSRLAALSIGVKDLLAQYPNLKGGQSLVIPIKTLAIFTHGESYSLQAEAKGGWIGSVEKWVAGVTPYLSSSPSILMFACSTSGTPTDKTKAKRTQGLPFAEAVRQELQKQLTLRDGENAKVAPEVWGHTVPGHTTANSTLKGFSGGAISSTGVSLLNEMGSRMAELAINNVGGGVLKDTQQQTVKTKARAAMVTILRATTGAKDPTNTYFRDIPLIGIDQVWEQLSTKTSPDFSALGLAEDAARRMEKGLEEFRKRFDIELPKLQKHIEKLLESLNK